jgi:hypothetical protein
LKIVPRHLGTSRNSTRNIMTVPVFKTVPFSTKMVLSLQRYYFILVPFVKSVPFWNKKDSSSKIEPSYKTTPSKKSSHLLMRQKLITYWSHSFAFLMRKLIESVHSYLWIAIICRQRAITRLYPNTLKFCRYGRIWFHAIS